MTRLQFFMSIPAMVLGKIWNLGIKEKLRKEKCVVCGNLYTQDKDYWLLIPVPEKINRLHDEKWFYISLDGMDKERNTCNKCVLAIIGKGEIIG